MFPKHFPIEFLPCTHYNYSKSNQKRLLYVVAVRT